MKFDCIIMNPPYQRNLHLKILAEAIKHLKDEKSVVVNLSPAGWLKEKMHWRKNTAYAYFAKKFRGKFDNVEFVSKETANKLFNIGIDKDLGIMVAKQNGNYDIDQFVNALKKDDFLYAKVLTKLTKFNGTMKSVQDILVSNKTSTGSYATMPIVFGAADVPVVVSKSFETFSREKTIAKKSEEHGYDKMKVAFGTEQELRNFHKYLFTSFVRYIVFAYKTSLNIYALYPYIPYFGDAINPRTGLKGYTSEWTDDDLHKFFNITQEEQKVIEETMKKYK